MTNTPTNRDEFAALATYRGPSVVANKERFEQINSLVAACFDPLMAAERDDLGRALAQVETLTHPIQNSWMRLLAQDCLLRLHGLHQRGRRLDAHNVTGALMGLRMWLNLALLHDALGSLDNLRPPREPQP